MGYVETMISPLVNNQYLKIIYFRTKAELRAEASNGFLGLIWWLLEPILYMAVFYFIFAVLRIRGGENFIPFLLTGLVAWKWFASSVFQGMSSIVREAGLMQQVYLPKIIFPLISVLVGLFKFIIVFSLLIGFLILYGIDISFSSLSVLTVLFVQLVLTVGVVCISAAVLPFVPDIKVIVSNALTLVFFLSGIFFDISTAPAHLQPYLYLNPVALLVEAYRAALLNGQLPDWEALTGVLLFSSGLVLVAWLMLRRFDRIYPKVLVK